MFQNQFIFSIMRHFFFNQIMIVVIRYKMAMAQLSAFRDGSRRNSVQMGNVAAKLNDREIRAVADYMAGLR